MVDLEGGALADRPFDHSVKVDRMVEWSILKGGPWQVKGMVEWSIWEWGPWQIDHSWQVQEWLNGRSGKGALADRPFLEGPGNGRMVDLLFSYLKKQKPLPGQVIWRGGLGRSTIPPFLGGPGNGRMVDLGRGGPWQIDHSTIPEKSREWSNGRSFFSLKEKKPGGGALADRPFDYS